MTVLLLSALLATPALAQTPSGANPALVSCTSELSRSLCWGGELTPDFDACPDTWTCVGVNCCPPWMSIEDCSKFNGIGPHQGDDWDDADDSDKKNGNNNDGDDDDDDDDDDDRKSSAPSPSTVLSEVLPGVFNRPSGTANVTVVPSATAKAGDDDDDHDDHNDDNDNNDDGNDDNDVDDDDGNDSDDDDDDKATPQVTASPSASASVKETPAIALSPSPSAAARSSAAAAPGSAGANADSGATCQRRISLTLATLLLGAAGWGW
ncbi:hypothetical protein A1Q2_00297 [Trichosporon asahii var. asahii CBS 8904]|uniref:Uncharacterized protein n=1 Tax=Trichosporon asahii var. asahii (strain CBS 8904) TaxID=1220162 RepID=K1VMH8_TRIAC|nr:hypothetical protein A1Q2_00297 [Trichosporon asahii var. asahii CBS 8904]